MSYRKYSIDEGCFDSLNSEKAYVLGWIYGDGAIYKDPRGICRVLVCGSEAEREHLLKIRSVMGSSHPLRFHAGAYTFEIGSKRLYESVKSFGKAGVGKDSWPVLPPGLYKAFCRGLLDSDGCVLVRSEWRNDYRYDRHRRYRQLWPFVQFGGKSKCIVEGFRAYLDGSVGLPPRVISENGRGDFSVCFSGSSALSVMRELYDGGLSHPRKGAVLSDWLALGIGGSSKVVESLKVVH